MGCCHRRPTPTQQKQLDYLKACKRRELPFLVHAYDVSCKDCKESHVMHSADRAHSFVITHAGHRTWVKNLGATHPLQAAS